MLKFWIRIWYSADPMALMQEINKLKKAKLTQLRFSLYSINRQIDLLTINLDRKCQIVPIIVYYLIFFSTDIYCQNRGVLSVLVTGGGEDKFCHSPLQKF